MILSGSMLASCTASLNLMASGSLEYGPVPLVSGGRWCFCPGWPSLWKLSAEQIYTVSSPKWLPRDDQPNSEVHFSNV